MLYKQLNRNQTALFAFRKQSFFSCHYSFSFQVAQDSLFHFFFIYPSYQFPFPPHWKICKEN